MTGGARWHERRKAAETQRKRAKKKEESRERRQKFRPRTLWVSASSASLRLSSLLSPSVVKIREA
jgi:hypothetical protein